MKKASVLLALLLLAPPVFATSSTKAIVAQRYYFPWVWLLSGKYFR